jgi:hypothetical protein
LTKIINSNKEFISIEKHKELIKVFLSIIGKITGTTIEDIVIGVGSDADRFVATTTGLAAGTTSFTIANRTTDGTNYKMTVDPDANFTGSIAFTIKGFILED